MCLGLWCLCFATVRCCFVGAVSGLCCLCFSVFMVCCVSCCCVSELYCLLVIAFFCAFAVCALYLLLCFMFCGLWLVCGCDFVMVCGVYGSGCLSLMVFGLRAFIVNVFMFHCVLVAIMVWGVCVL